MGLLQGVFGSKPSVPTWNDINLNDQQTKAISANQGALPGAEQLATGVNSFNQDQLTQLFNNIMPGWSGATSNASKNIQDEISGKIPTDVAGNIQSSAAAQALTGGFGGSGLAGNLTAKDLGLTSLDLTGQGLSSLESWTSMIDKMFSPGQFNISSMFVTPQQEFEDTFQNQQQAWGAQWMQNQVNAMPDPVLSGINAEIMSLAKSFVGGMGGKMGGGGGGGGGGGNDSYSEGGGNDSYSEGGGNDSYSEGGGNDSYSESSDFANV